MNYGFHSMRTQYFGHLIIMQSITEARLPQTTKVSVSIYFSQTEIYLLFTCCFVPKRTHQFNKKSVQPFKLFTYFNQSLPIISAQYFLQRRRCKYLINQLINTCNVVKKKKNICFQHQVTLLKRFLIPQYSRRVGSRALVNRCDLNIIKHL